MSLDGHNVRPKNGLRTWCGCFLVILLCIYSLAMAILVFSTAKVNLWLVAPLGNDPNGFFPASVGAPPRWRTFVRNESNPYHIPDDVFASRISTREAVDRLVQTHCKWRTVPFLARQSWKRLWSKERQLQRSTSTAATLAGSMTTAARPPCRQRSRRPAWAKTKSTSYGVYIKCAA